jgi:hypothetical protein
VSRVVRWQPRLGLRLLAGAGRALNRAGLYAPPAAHVVEVFGTAAAGRAATIAADLTALDIQNRTIRRLLRDDPRGLENVTALVRTDADARLAAVWRDPTPLVLVSWHAGLTPAIAAVLERAAVPSLVVRSARDYPDGRYVQVAVTGSAPGGHTLALKQAADALRRGDAVVLALDAEGQDGCAAVCLGRVVSWRRGAFMLGRALGARLVPVLARWADDRRAIVVDVGDPLAAPSCTAADGARYEAELAQAAAAWLERYLRDHPGVMFLEMLDALRRAPRAASPEAGRYDPSRPPADTSSTSAP